MATSPTKTQLDPITLQKKPSLITPRLLVAPTEPRSLKAIATHITLFPESMGCDVLYYSYSPYSLIGFQRKEIGDFISSLNDGRLQKELLQIQESPLTFAVLLLEGPIIYTNDGNLVNGTFTRASLRNILSSIQSQHIIVSITDNLQDTIETVASMGKYLAKPTHSSLSRRPNQAKNTWGRTTSESFATHILQSFPGIGPTTAKAMYQYFHAIPLQWTVSASELSSVPGIGIKTAKQLINTLKPEA
jgi:ERCC4-type nuclease